jgi:hypothetical protein
MIWILLLTTAVSVLWRARHKLPLFLLPLLVAASPPRTLEEKLRDAALAQPRAWYAAGSQSPGALETQDEYEARIDLAIHALAKATREQRKDGTYRVIPPNWWYGVKVLDTAVLAHWYEESRLAYEIHAGIDHPVWTQDVGRARCLGQLHAGLVPLHDWEELAGLDEDATQRCALWTARALTRMALYCGKGRRGADKIDDILLPMFSAMGGGGCSPTVSGRAKLARFGKMWREVQRR